MSRIDYSKGRYALLEPTNGYSDFAVYDRKVKQTLGRFPSRVEAVKLIEELSGSYRSILREGESVYEKLRAEEVRDAANKEFARRREFRKSKAEQAKELNDWNQYFLTASIDEIVNGRYVPWSL